MDISKICSGIILFNPEIERLKKSIESIYFQVTKLFLFDNCSDNINEIRSVIDSYDNIVLCDNDVNIGIAAALNRICKTAYDNGFSWMLTLDQDTICDKNLIIELSKCINNDIGIVCPNVYYENLYRNINNKNINKNIYEVKACMTSGSLTNLDVWKKVLGFREDFFIDYVDNDFCMKVHINGYKIIRVNNVYIYHQIGDAKTINFPFFGKKYFIVHKPFRYYYMVRNMYIFIFNYKKYINFIKESVKLFYLSLFGIIINDNRKEVLNNILKGIKDGKLYCKENKGDMFIC